MRTYLIKDLERLSGIKAHTIRIWEQRYNLLTPTRTDTNIRHYLDHDLKKLLNISLLQTNGYKISKLSKMDDSQIYSEIENILNIPSENKSDLESKIQGLILSMVELDEIRFNQIFNKAVYERGFQTTVINLIYPFLMRIGVMWGMNELFPAQEHFITCLIRQKLVAAINELPQPNKEKTYLIYLPAEERHEMGVLLGNYIIKSLGYKTIYLGADVPQQDIIDIVHQLNPDYLFSILTIKKDGQIQNKHLDSLLNSFESIEILISGSSYVLESIPNHKRIKKLGNIQEFIDFVKS